MQTCLACIFYTFNFNFKYLHFRLFRQSFVYPITSCSISSPSTSSCNSRSTSTAKDSDARGPKFRWTLELVAPKLFNFLSQTEKFFLISSMGKTKGGFYAVARGKQVGIFSTWDDCKAQVDGFPNARYKKFNSQAEADDFIKENSAEATSSTGTPAVSKITFKSKTQKPVTDTVDGFDPQQSTNQKGAFNPLAPESLIALSKSSSTGTPALSKFVFKPKPQMRSSVTALSSPTTSTAASEKHRTDVDPMEVFHPQLATSNNSAFNFKASGSFKPLSDSQFQAQQKRSIAVLKQARFPVSSPSSSSTYPSVSNSIQNRNFSTTNALNKRNLKAKEEIVVNKRQKMNPTSSSSNKINDANLGVNLSNFTVDSDGYVVVYTDGACSKNGRKGAKAGIGIWFGDGHTLNLSEPVRGRQTNNTAEILAAEKAILQAKKGGIDKLNVQTDSQFVINCITMWINKWKRNGWKLATGKPVINRFDLEKLDAAMGDMDIKWSYVAGHSGHYGNEAADRLAVEGANKT